MTQFTRESAYHGDLEILRRQSDGVIVVTFDPTEESLRQAGRKREGTQPAVLAEIHPASKIMKIYPIVTLPIPDRFMEPKYDKIRCIELPIEEPYFDLDDSMGADEFIEMLSSLPRGLIHNPQYGLGVAKDSQTIVDTVEELTECAELVLSDSEMTHTEDVRLVLALHDFER